MDAPPTDDDVRAKLAAVKRAAEHAEVSAAGVVEQIDPSFPRWHVPGGPGEPDDPPEPLRSALGQLDAVVAMRRAVVDAVVAFEGQARERRERARRDQHA